MYKKSSYLSIAGTALLALSLSLAGCSSNKDTAAGTSSASNGYQKMEIKLSHVATDNTPKGQAALKFKEIVEEKSDGVIQVDVFPSGQLYGDNDEIEALQANNVQIIAPSGAKLSGFEKSFEVFDLPFMFKDAEALYQFEDGEGGKKLLSKLDQMGMVGLDFWPNGFKHITNNKKDVTEPSDLKGLKIRTHGGTIINEVYEKLGAASSKIAFNETYQALQLGTVDGQENSLVNIESQKYQEVQKYMTITGHARSEYVLVANQEWWNSLNEKTKELMNEAVKESTKTGREVEEQYEKDALEAIKKSGKVKLHELTEGERQTFIEELEPVFNKWSKEIDSDVLKKAEEANE
ncbi:DctP family TRAP transporter solute-binding subunit [Bacillus massiliglaciei]|uniref:DctP family TRAP transporter solute-binding subunit n=1 Tax=Bacillus massiliglaciei TaxID=1816693 RepID=UPI000AC47C4D|nr:DctP family TRAP transporter solute-binding subunit [Bacillus massiliglaciei]